MKKLNFFSISLLLAVAFICQSYSHFSINSNAAYDQSGWKILGQTTVKEGLDRDEIRVKAKKGKFSQLKIQVKKAPIEMTKMVVMFENGGKQVIWPKKNFKADSWSRVFQIKGGKKAIKKVVFYYSKKNSDDVKPVVHLWGRQK